MSVGRRSPGGLSDSDSPRGPPLDLSLKLILDCEYGNDDMKGLISRVGEVVVLENVVCG